MNYVYELATGYGKTKLALDTIDWGKNPSIIVFVPRKVLIENWKKEIKKWGYKVNYNRIRFITYVSLPKYAELSGKFMWDYIVYDECHHISDRCKMYIGKFNSKHNIFLSATIKYEMKCWLYKEYKHIIWEKKNIKTAIEEERLPNPDIYKWGLELDDKNRDYIYIRNKSKKGVIRCSYDNVGNYKFINTQLHISCTQKEYYDLINQDIEYWEGRFKFGDNSLKSKQMWLRKCKDRLEYLAEIKDIFIRSIMRDLKKERFLIFCGSIDQCDRLTDYSVHSKNKSAMEILDKFNKRKINHIAACNILNEGINLSECKYGIFGVINSSEIMTVQKVGRILRHKHPNIIIPYFIGTREEQLVNRMLENYDKEKIRLWRN